MKRNNFFDTVWGHLHIHVRRPVELELGEHYFEENLFCDGYDEDGKPLITATPPGLKEEAKELAKRVTRERG